MARPRAWRAILVGGLMAGVLDITYACIFSYFRRGLRPLTVLQSVASGALGRSAYDGGFKTGALGLAFHFLIAFTAAAVYFLASRVLRVMVTRAILCGIIYGLCVYLVMYGLVLRFSAIRLTTYPWSFPWPVLIGNVLIHTLGIGLPIALAVRRFSK